MENTRLKRELIIAKNKRPSDFWEFMIAFTSILHGSFLFKFVDYLTNHAEPYLSRLPGRWIGLFLLIAGILNLLGVLLHNKHLKELSIWVLSAIWGGLCKKI